VDTRQRRRRGNPRSVASNRGIGHQPRQPSGRSHERRGSTRSGQVQARSRHILAHVVDPAGRGRVEPQPDAATGLCGLTSSAWAPSVRGDIYLRFCRVRSSLGAHCGGARVLESRVDRECSPSFLDRYSAPPRP
jgi:hypothetical protein